MFEALSAECRRKKCKFRKLTSIKCLSDYPKIPRYRFDAETWHIRGGGGGGHQAYIIAANALASYVARSSAAILIVIYCG